MFFCLSCIGVDVTDDYVEPSIRITSPQIISIRVGQQFQFSAKYFDASGSLVEEPNFEWDVIPEDAMSIDNNGLAIAEKSAEATLSVHVETTLGNVISDSTSFSILDANINDTTNQTDTSTASTDVSSTTTETATTTLDNDAIILEPQTYSGFIRTTSSYKLTGSFSYEIVDGQLVLFLGDDYEASTSLPGLYVYLSNNPNSTAEAYEIGAVTVFNGAHSYTLPDSIKINDFKYILYWCKPFNVKVGDATIF